MYASMYVYVYVYLYVYVCMYVCMYVCIYVCMCCERHGLLVRRQGTVLGVALIVVVVI